MSEAPIITIQPHEEAVWALIQHPSLDDATIDRMQAEVLAAATAKGSMPVILDLSSVRFVPSTGLGALVTLMRSLKKDGRRFILVGLQPDVRKILAVTHLDKVLEIRASFEDALKQLRNAT